MYRAADTVYKRLELYVSQTKYMRSKRQHLCYFGNAAVLVAMLNGRMPTSNSCDSRPVACLSEHSPTQKNIRPDLPSFQYSGASRRRTLNPPTHTP